jgi:hypothetical protein
LTRLLYDKKSFEKNQRKPAKVSQMISKERLIQITETSINGLIAAYRSTPYLFYAENDLHAFLYRVIFDALPTETWRCSTLDGKSSILLHEEYPTKERYRKRELLENAPKGRRGHFDLCIWNPEKTGDRRLRVTQSTRFEEEQQAFIAIEFDLVGHSDSLKQTIHDLKWNLLKLKSLRNEVEHGYSLIFVRHWIHTNEFLSIIRDEVRKERKVKVLYAEKTRDQDATVGTLSAKSFLDYGPIFK